MWQSAALAGALSLGGAVPTEFGTAWARLSRMGMAPVAVNAAAPVRMVRRSIMVLMGLSPCRASVVAQALWRSRQVLDPRLFSGDVGGSWCCRGCRQSAAVPPIGRV